MERYIDANRLINFIRQSKIQDKTAVLAAIDLQHSFNLDKIVICEQCKCWNREHISCEGLARCLNGESGIRFRGRNDFCSKGVSRT